MSFFNISDKAQHKELCETRSAPEKTEVIYSKNTYASNFF